MTFDDITDRGDRIREDANAAYDHAKQLARAANTGMIPAPTAYDILGNIKALLWALGEVTEHLPNGLAQSLEDPRIVVYDRGVEERDPATQIQIASDHLTKLTTALSVAAEEADLAQQAISRQGYDHA